MFRLFAELIAFHIKKVERLAIAETKLLEELKTAELREQFIAILWHDLRNPVGAVSTAAEMLVSMPLENQVKRLSNIILNSSYRMKGLIENILDFARGKLGGSITLNLNDHALDETLEQVITELRISWLDKIIETSFDLAVPVNCDARRLAQLFSNLLGNSLTHGKKDTAVRVNAESNNESFTFSVFNCGEKIPDAAMKRLFRPFARGEFELSKEGLPGVIYCF